MAANKTSLSAGAIIRGILLQSDEVVQHTNNIYPVVTDKAVLPYIVYRRAALEHEPTKTKQPGADTVQMDVVCYTATYAEGVELAEAVRAALDYAEGEKDGLVMRSCTLTDSEESYEDDAFMQLLSFNVKI